MYLWNFVFGNFSLIKTFKCSLQHNDWGFWRPYNVVAKFSPIFKGPDVLPQRFPNFGKTNNLVSLTAKLSCYARNLWIKFLCEKNTLVRLSLACDGRIFFFHLTLFLLRETNLSSTFTKCLWFVPWVRLYWQQSFSSWQIEGRTYFTLLADRFFNLNKQNSSKVRTVSLSDTYQLYQAIGLKHERPSII